MEEIFKFLNSIFPLSPACIAYIRSVIRHKKVSKNEVLLRIGEVDRNLYFIVKGALRCYYYVKDKEVTAWFFCEGETVVSIGSWYEQVPSEDCIIADEDGEVYYITREQYDHICRTWLEFNFVARVLLEKYLKEFHAHARFIRKVPAPERYHRFLEKMPHIAGRIPVGPCATWLNMEPETLSRIRGERD